MVYIYVDYLPVCISGFGWIKNNKSDFECMIIYLVLFFFGRAKGAAYRYISYTIHVGFITSCSISLFVVNQGQMITTIFYMHICIYAQIDTGRLGEYVSSWAYKNFKGRYISTRTYR
jgi:hypothetical protein